MFWEIFVKLCADNGEKPTPLITKLGFSKSNVSYWKKGHVPQAVALHKIADYFGVTIESLLGKENEAKSKPPAITEAELNLIKAFNNASPSIRKAIQILLGL